MYQAIVFLPLLGAILAAIISLAGARARFPGEGPPPGVEDTLTDKGPHLHPEPIDEHAGVIHASHHEDGHAHEPAAAGSRTTELITTTLLMVSMVLSWIAFVQVGFGHHDLRVPIFTWITSGDLKIDWSLRIDTLTVVMLVVVTTVSAFVHLYSIGYMEEDPFRPRFFGYLSMFTFAMLMLVTADNLVQMFFGWEGVGLASYLLIGFWYHKPEANAAAIKAFVVNRVGDFGFALGIFSLFALVGAVDFDTVFAQAPTLVGKTMHIFGWDLDALTLDLPAAVHGRHGQVGAIPAAHLAARRHGRPDAGLGADPRRHHGDRRRVHGGAAVAAVRTRPQRADLRHLHRRHHRIFAATIGLVQNDIKRIVAYSTCSQLGYMFVAMGVGAYSVGMFHLFTHAFFKALLFLGCGSVIVAMHHEQDIRHMGGLQGPHPLYLCGDGHRHAGLDRLPAHRRLFLQGCDHRGGLCRPQSDGALCFHLHGRRGAAHLVLFLAADLQDLPRRAARPPSLARGA